MLILQIQSTDALTKFLFKAQVIDTGIDTVISAVCVISTILAAIFFFCNLGFNYAVNALKSLKDKDVKSFVDYEELARTLVLIGCILIYPAIAHTLEAGMDAVNQGTVLDVQTMQKYEKLVASQGKLITQQNTKEANDSAIFAKAAKDPALTQDLSKYAAQMGNDDAEQSATSTTATAQPQNQNELGFWDKVLYYINPVNWVNIIVSTIVAMVCQLIRVIIACITYNVLKVLFCVGPLAFAFSILPPFKNNITTWFATVLNTGFVFTTLNILDAVFYETVLYADNVVKNSDGTLQSVTANLAMNITMIILYLMSFWLTSKYVGKGDAGRVLSKGIGIATALVGGAMIAEGAASATNVANVTHSANDAITGK